MPSKRTVIVASVVVATLAGGVFLILYDPTVPVRLQNDSNKLLDLSCESGNVIAKPNEEVTIPVSWAQPEPCFVTIGRDRHNHAGPYGGCVYVNPPVDRFTLLSQATHHWSIPRCSALGSR